MAGGRRFENARVSAYYRLFTAISAYFGGGGRGEIKPQSHGGTESGRGMIGRGIGSGVLGVRELWSDGGGHGSGAANRLFPRKPDAPIRLFPRLPA